MMQFEDELRKALARREPSEGFAAQVLERLNISPDSKPRTRLFSWPVFSWRIASVAVLFLALVSGLAYREHVRIEKGEAAKKQLLIAMHIAGTQLHEAQLRVKRIRFPEVVMQ
jgi:hypothetical protein